MKKYMKPEDRLATLEKEHKRLLAIPISKRAKKHIAQLAAIYSRKSRTQRRIDTGRWD